MSEVFICWRCGKELTLKHEMMYRIYCDDCVVKQKEENDRINAEYASLRIRVMHEKALSIMEKSGHCYMHEYLDSAHKILKKALDGAEKYMSAHEMIVAMVLDNYQFNYESNFKILNYRVDFYIPELKVCLEVDGAQHSHRLEYDSQRDIELRNALGASWEIVRIKTGYIEKNPEKLVDAIEALANEKRRLRKKNNGIMPYGFSKRENALYEKLLNK